MPYWAGVVVAGVILCCAAASVQASCRVLNMSVPHRVTYPSNSEDASVFATWSDARLWLIYFSEKTGFPQFYLTNSTDGGWSWPPESQHPQITSDTQFRHFHPHVVVTPNGGGGERFHLAYFGIDTSPPYSANVRYSYSDDYGVSWSTHVALTTGTAINWVPFISVESGGVLTIAFASSRSGHRESWVFHSFDNGVNWESGDAQLARVTAVIDPAHDGDDYPTDSMYDRYRRHYLMLWTKYQDGTAGGQGSDNQLWGVAAVDRNYTLNTGTHAPGGGNYGVQLTSDSGLQNIYPQWFLLTSDGSNPFPAVPTTLTTNRTSVCVSWTSTQFFAAGDVVVTDLGGVSDPNTRTSLTPTSESRPQYYGRLTPVPGHAGRMLLSWADDVAFNDTRKIFVRLVDFDISDLQPAGPSSSAMPHISSSAMPAAMSSTAMPGAMSSAAPVGGSTGAVPPSELSSTGLSGAASVRVFSFTHAVLFSFVLPVVVSLLFRSV